MRSRLVIAAHADDETIGCGGMIAKYARQGADVLVGVLTRDSDDEAHQLRREEARGAWGLLGAREAGWASLRAHPLIRDAAVVDIVGEWLTTMRPEIVFIPHPEEQDPDHATVAQIVGSAKLSTGSTCTVLGYEVWTPMQRPLLFEDISKEIETKRAAIEYFASQTARRDYADGTTGLNRYRGSTSGRGTYVEAFCAVPL